MVNLHRGLCAAEVRDSTVCIVLWRSWHSSWFVALGPKGDKNNWRRPHQDYSLYVSFIIKVMLVIRTLLSYTVNKMLLQRIYNWDWSCTHCAASLQSWHAHQHDTLQSRLSCVCGLGQLVQARSRLETLQVNLLFYVYGIGQQPMNWKVFR